ncbi:CopG family ribbon-helix-helix protein [Cellvibrio sp. OA-2007]|uniref:CopG family ribbon-helix-helix protein n=1 Tax=Cellvibrio sp. OA-2007 TaxID=529823 RepID=UPI00078198D2|nr:ribbon-helix-helix protein, CopG family [Cellvibrio sp. OA-2007]
MSITSVRLQPEVEQGLEAMAISQERSKSWLINQALKEYIERQTQEKTRWQETLHAMDSVAKGQVVSGEAVQLWLESWGKDDEKSPPQVGQ